MSGDFRIRLANGHSLHATERFPAFASSDERDGFLVIVVHGGPGINSSQECLEGIFGLLSASFSQKIIKALIFYDQLGCGESDKPPLPDEKGSQLCTLPYYVEELHQVICAVKDRHGSDHRLCLLGYSWGGQLVLEYLLGSGQNSVDCAIVSNAALNEGTYEQRQQQIRKAMDDDLREFLEEDERELSSSDEIGARIYRKLVGVSDARITGEMVGWDALERVRQLPCSCFFVSGYDDTVPHKDYSNILAMDLDHLHEVLILKDGDHSPFYGNTSSEYFEAITKFLCRHF